MTAWATSSSCPQCASPTIFAEMGACGRGYADFGPLHQFARAEQQVHQLYAVVDFTGGVVDVEAGVGFGLTSASDGLTIKVILSRDLNSRPVRHRQPR